MSVSDWRLFATCQSVDPEIFFPSADAGPVYAAQVAVAKAICAGCPVRAECLDEALARIPYGIAGGLTPEERRGRRRRVAAASTSALAAGLRRGATRAEIEAAGRVLLIAGRPVREVAQRCGVSERTAVRWAARIRSADLDGAEGRASTGEPERHRSSALRGCHAPSAQSRSRREVTADSRDPRSQTGSGGAASSKRGVA